MFACAHGVSVHYQGVHSFHNFTKRKLYQKVADARTAKFMKRQGKTSALDDVIEDKVAEARALEERKRQEEENERSKEAGTIYWQYNFNPNDRVVQEHYRKVHSFSFSEEKIGSMDVLRVRVAAGSFMYHQIRKMIGTSCAIALGYIPEELLPVLLGKCD